MSFTDSHSGAEESVFNVFVIGKPFDEVHREYHRKLEIIKTGAIAD